MKRKVTILLMMLLPMMVMGQDYRVQVDNVWYTMNGNYAKALSASNCSGDIVIPKTVTYYINGISHNATVIGIMEGAFARSAIQGVTIPNTVTSISSDAFRGCSQLASIVVEEGNSKYDSRDNCNAIVETGSNTLITGCKNTVIPNTVTTIDSYAFFGCTGLTALNIPNSVTTIGSYAFYGCTGLTTLTIPGNVTNVDGFSDCINLVTVIMQNGVTNIATNAFYGCSSLANVTFPNSVMSIGSGAFDGTAWYNNLPEGMVYVGNVAFSYKGTMPANTNLVFRDGTTGIAGSAFAGCTGIISVTIPNTVETIGSRAFRDCTNLMFATIGNSVTSIGDYAFDYCNYLTSVTVGMATPITITDRTFSNKSKAKLYVPNGRGTDYNAAAYWQDFKEIVEISPSTSAPKISFADPIVKNICLDQWDTNGDRELSMQEAAAVTDLGSTFRNRKTITSFDELQYFTGLTSIGNGAFNGCTNLTRVTIPSSVTSIGNTAFYDCAGLEDITIPGGVTTIGNYAFYNCKGLVSLTIPNSVTSIGEKSFQYCSGLVSMAIEDAATSIGASAFNGCSNLASASLGNAVTSIGQSAFFLCTSLSSIDIPNSISTIEGYTFYQCTSLANVTIPNSVTSIGSNVFYKCTSLENIVIPNTVTIIGQSAFEDCSGLKNITIPKSVKSIGNKAFYNTGIYNNASDGVFYVDKWACGYKGTMPSNASIAFDEGTYAVSANAFNSCNEIMEITIPNSVVIIDVMAFAYCSNLTTVTIGNSVTSIGSYAFDCSNLATVTVGATTPPTLESNGLSSYFENNGSLFVPVGSKTAYKAADNWKNVLIIYENSPRIVFADATVKAVCVEKWDTDGDHELSEYEAGLVTSLDNAFYIKREQITSFDELRYFTGLTTIGSDDFNGCIALKSITIPSGVTTINPFAFNQSALETLSIDANNATFYSPSGSNAIINRSTKELVKGCKTTIIPADVTSIGERAFYYCTGLTSVDIPNGVNSIADYAFENCSALVSVTIPNTVKSIGEMAFRHCPMTSINIPEGVETIGNNAFWNCTGLTSIVLPGSISSLGQYVFRGCTNLATVTITDGIEAIGGSMFYSCRNLTSITIPSSVTSIGSSAFYGCSNLENITIPSSVASIGGYAFNNCSALSSVTVDWQTPINISSSVFSNSNQSNATLYVPAGRVAAYKAASYWKNFNIKEQGTVWTVTSTDDIPAGTKYELDDITLTIGEAGSPDFRVDPERGAYDETFEYPIIGNEVNGNKEGGTFYLFTPKKNGNLTVVVNQNKIKEFYVEESGRVMDAFNGITKEDEVTEGNYIGTYTIPVFANLTYKIYCAGSKMGFYGFTFEGRNDADKTNITFADEKVKALCIANWDTDHNGELSMAEAAAVTTIGEIFKENEEITSFDELRFFTGLTELTGACFYTCTKLKSITIPSGITNIAGGYAFGNCTELEQISVDAGNTAFDSRLQCNAIIETASNTLVVGCQTTNIPATVTAIGGAAFWGRWGMSWMDIPESVSSIDYAAFAYCPNLWSIQLPKGLTHIGEDAFNESNLTEVKVQNPVPVVLENANTFSNRANATLYVPVGSKAAYEAADIWKEFGKIVETGWAVTGTDDIPSGTKVELDDITMTIGQAGSPDFTVDPNAAYDETFKNYIAGNEVNGDREGGTFYLFTPKKNGDLTVVVRQNVRSQKKFYVEESGRVMDAFNGILPENTDNVYIGTYTIPVFANLTYKIYCAGSKMGFYGFTFEGRDDAEWTNIEFADEKVKALCVANWDTDHNGELSMTEAAAVTDLGEVFKQNEEITSFDELRFFTGLTDIPGWNTFNSCHSLTSVTIPASVTSIEGATFANCEALEHISVDPSNTKYCTLQNCNAIIERETNKLVVGCKAAEIPDGVTVIGTEAFHGSTLIQWIGIPESVTELEAGAFAWCISLEGVEIPSSVTKIGDWAFHQTALWSVTLPEKLTTIGENAFKDCNNLNEVKILNPDPIVLTNAETFSNRTNATLYVPNKSIATYKEANIWKDFNEIVGLYTNQIYSDDVTAYLGCPTEMAINLENEETYTAFQFDLVLPEGITLEKDEKGNVVFTKGNRYSGSRSISITPHEGNMYRIVSASMKNNEITGNSGALLTVSLLADESMEKKTYTANIENVILTKPDESQLEARSSTININTKEVLYGDSNDDGNVNVTDAVVSINNILGRPSDKFNKTQADINRDHIVDIFDVYLGLNIVRNKVRMMSRGVNGSDDKLSISDFTITPGETKQLQIELTNEASYAGFQFDLVLPEGISMTGYSVNQTRIPEEIEVDMEQTDGCYRFIAAGFGTEDISGTSGSIMKITLKANDNLKGRNLTGCLRDVKLSKLDGTGTTDKETAFNISNPTSGDMNGNSKLDKEDISEIVSLIMSGAYNAKADLNGDDKVNAVDLVLITNEVKEK